MRLREFIEEARAEELRDGKNGVRLIGISAPGRGLLVPWPPMSEQEWGVNRTNRTPAGAESEPSDA